MTEYKIINTMTILCVFIVGLVRDCSNNKAYTEISQRQNEAIIQNKLTNTRDSIELLRLQHNAIQLQKSIERINTLENEQDSLNDEISATKRQLRVLRSRINISNYQDSTYQSLKDRIK